MPQTRPSARRSTTVEWPTLGLILGTYGLWAAITTWGAGLSLPVAVALLTVLLAMHSSLTHEVLHGHPTPWQGLNAALVRPAVGLFVPYGRFRDTHLDHHHDETLTDPYEDPESNYLDPADWARLPGWQKALMRFNNTLLGRIVAGPAIGMAHFLTTDLRAMLAGNRQVQRSWLAHGVALLPVAYWLGQVAQMPLWSYALACYGALGLVRIRTFLEHRAHLRARARTVIVEDRGPLAFLFLNNNFHAVHHTHPGVAWYRLPGLYRQDPDRYLNRNEGYRYASYAEVFRSYFLRAKDPVAHPLRPAAGPLQAQQREHVLAPEEMGAAPLTVPVDGADPTTMPQQPEGRLVG